MDLLRRLGVRHPIFLAPMGGGPGSPELAAAVSKAGGLGSLGAAYMTPQQIRDAAARAGSLLHINLFDGSWVAYASGDTTRILTVRSVLIFRLRVVPHDV